MATKKNDAQSRPIVMNCKKEDLEFRKELGEGVIKRLPPDALKRARKMYVESLNMLDVLNMLNLPPNKPDDCDYTFELFCADQQIAYVKELIKQREAEKKKEEKKKRYQSNKVSKILQ